MNFFTKCRKQIRRISGERAFRRESGTHNFRLIPGWLLESMRIGSDFSSQFGQDWFVATHVFPNKKDGIFVDVGANHPIEINNTLFFEKQGWTGIAFEPQADLCELWKSFRKTLCLPFVLGSERKSVSFILHEAHTLSCVSSDKDQSASSEKHFISEQYRLDDVLREHKISHVDLLSIDVEGYEKEVLLGIDFQKIDITCVVIENDRIRDGDPLIRQFIKAAGYRHIARLDGDDVFIKRGSKTEKEFALSPPVLSSKSSNEYRVL
ncbi:MAG: FkbM family methyltransferase [bacterium]